MTARAPCAPFAADPAWLRCDFDGPDDAGHGRLRRGQGYPRQRAARAGTVPIIAMSANAYAEDVKKCLDSGMNAHISKPLFKDVMLRTIARFV